MIARNIEKELFAAAVGIEDEALRSAFLTQACGDSPEQRSRLEKLIESAQSSEQFFDKVEKARIAVAEEACLSMTAQNPLSPRLPASQTLSGEGEGTLIGRYKLLERIGEGGCGVVYLAEQQEPVQRRVALKVIRLGMDTESVIKRFEIERQSLALMDHPHIAHVLDAGATEKGRPYFVMEWVRGVKITEFCDVNRLDFNQRIDLFIDVCHAIQHAHQKGVIHRDIKPSNILVANHDGRLVPKVIDFGIAKATAGRLSEHTMITSVESPMGTPAYMSPEQADPKSMDVDTRSDVYSLGILLYELLVGRPPFDPRELAAAGMYETRRILTEREAPRLSSMLASLDKEELEKVARCRSSEPGKWMAAVKGDIEWVVLKALEKDPRRRYETVTGLATDLKRYLQNEPVRAHPPGKVYLLAKFVRRNRLVVSSVAGIIAALTVGMTLALFSFNRERSAKSEQMRLRQIAEEARLNESKLLSQASIRANIAQAAAFMAEGQIPKADEQLRLTPLSTIEPSLETENVLRSLGSWNAIKGRWAEAAECYSLLTQASRLSKPDEVRSTKDLVAVGPVLLEGKRVVDYNDYRRWVVDHLDVLSPLRSVEHLIKATLIIPADPRMMDELRPIRDQFEQDYANAQLVEMEKRTAISRWKTWSISLYEYRNGNFEKSILWSNLTLSMPSPNLSIQATCHATLAMAHHQAGHREDAERELAAARILLDLVFKPDLIPRNSPLGVDTGICWDWVSARILFREAEALMGNPQLAN
jgi:eukaryotic-like serine/threonine-protein kinase